MKKNLIDITPGNIQITATFLGRSDIWVNGKLITDLSTIKAKSLLIYLVLEGKEPKSRSYLASLFWPDVPENTALHNLRQAIVLIKKSIENMHLRNDWIITSRDEIVIQPNVFLNIDVHHFCDGMKRLLGSLNSYPDRGFPIQSLQKLLSMYKGEFLKSLSLPDADLFEEWLTLNRESINQLAIRGSAWLFQYHEKRKEWHQALQIAENLVKLAPWDEEVHERLIHCLLMLSQRSAAVTHYHYAVHYFQEELKVEPGEYLQKAFKQINNDDKTRDSNKNENRQIENLPRYATQFIGRSREIEILESWVTNPQCNIVTIIGPGGSGKTRLVKRLAELQVSLFRDGVYFVTLANCASATQIASTILSLIKGVAELKGDAVEQLIQWAVKKKALLILDNVEDTSETASFAASLLEKSPDLLLVFTSYTALGLHGERIFKLQGLPLVAKDEKESNSEAVQLFLSHLQRDQQSENFSREFIKSVCQICELVEGMPLAIDLAAWQTRFLPVSTLLNELKQNMDVLQFQAVNLPERHRSIQASFENVWLHLPDPRKKALTLLTGFYSSFTQQAADSIYQIKPSELCALADQSLLSWDTEERYFFHRTIKQYARAKLTLNEDESRELSQRHAGWFLEQMSIEFSDKGLENFSRFISSVQQSIEDITQAMKWFILHKEWQKVKLMLNIVFGYFEGRGLFNEGSEFFSKMADLCGQSTDGIECCSKFSSRASLFLIRIYQYQRASDLCQFALENAKKNNWHAEIAFCLNIQSTQAFAEKNLSKAECIAAEALSIAIENSLLEEQSHALYNLGNTQYHKGEISQASANLTKCKQLCLELKLWQRLSKTYNILANIACTRGELTEALDSFSQALSIVKGLGNKFSEALVANNIGTVYMELNQHPSALEYLNQSLDICREILDFEGESVALSNLGEIALKEGQLQESIQFGLESLKVSRMIESIWSELSARIILAEAYRKSMQLADSRDQILDLLQKSISGQFTSFYYRGLVEGCQLLMNRGYTQGLAKILSDALEEEGMDDFVKMTAQELIQHLPPLEPGDATLSQNEVLALFSRQLSKI